MRVYISILGGFVCFFSSGWRRTKTNSLTFAETERDDALIRAKALSKDGKNRACGVSKLLVYSFSLTTS